MDIHPVPGVRDASLGIDRGTPWGFLLHTTGGGVTDDAVWHVVNGKRVKRPTPLHPIDVVTKIYIDSQNGSNGYYWGGPHYVIDLDGQVYQLALDNLMTAHCGGGNRRRYFDGSWERDCSPKTVEQWKDKWPRAKHPYSLFPNPSPNHDYVGVEMIPIGDGFGQHDISWTIRFTQAQFLSALQLARDCAIRHGWPAGWQHSTRLLGHEDVDPLNRSDVGGGWDPGFLRDSPYWDMSAFRSVI